MTITERTIARALIVVIPLISALITLGASAAEPPRPAGMQCATAKRTVIDADGTIHIVTRTVCK